MSEINKISETDFSLSTEEFAALNKVKPSSVLRRHSVTGSYFGAVPLKLANGRLVWPSKPITK